MRTPVRIAAAVAAALAVAFLAGPASAQAQVPPPPTGTIKTRLKVSVPDEKAELLIEDTVTKSTGKLREFESPPLDAGKEYEYLFKVSWRPNNYTVMSRTKAVQFKAGDELAIDLTKDTEKDKAVIRFVATPADVIAQMVKLAAVEPADVVFEPGCGQADITIAAVKAGAKRGVGVDIDKDRVAEAKQKVETAGLKDKIDVRLGDALDIKDFSDATVVFMYMGDEFNALIRPVLWKQLKVGTRVVSHRFTMGDWKPDRTVTVKGEDGDEYLVHLWTITEDAKKRAADGK
ncbi:MAG: TIGR03000 domain-containing protein [Fimbriiglobus sp.]